MQNVEYSKNKGISQSQIKKFRYISPREWKKLYIDKDTDDVKDNQSFTLGSLVDTLCFTPEELETRFYIGTMPEMPSEAVVGIISSYYNSIILINEANITIANDMPGEVETLPLDLSISELLISCANNYKTKDKDGNEKIGWNTGWKEQTRIDSLIKNGSSYFESLKEAKGRKIISHSMNIEAIELRNILQTHPDTKDYFIQNNDNLLLFQLEIFSNYKSENETEVPVKGALDIVRFNHIDKTVQIIDFKTSYSAFNFLKSIKEYSYCDQLSFYTFLLKQWLQEYCEGKYCNYRMIEPINIVIDIKEKQPYTYSYDWIDLEIARKGNKEFLAHLYQTNEHNARIKTGWEQILNDISWHFKSGDWSAPKELILNKRIKVNLQNS